MDPLWLSLIAIVVVILSVLLLKLHPFLALSLAALLVAVCTPTAQLLDVALDEEALRVTAVESAELSVDKGKPASGRNLVYRKSVVSNHYEQVGEVFLYYSNSDNQQVSIERNGFPLEASDLVLHASRATVVSKASKESAGQRLSFGFGDTCRKIGILIAMASIIGTCLLESGAARRIVDSTREFVGEKRTPVAFTLSGFVVGIPVFFDTVFYLLMPLAKAMRLKTGKNYLLYVMSIVVGATMAHSLVPPTPGPLFVAAKMGVSIGMMMAGGIVVGLISVAVGFLYVLWANRIWEIPLRDQAETTADISEDDMEGAPSFVVSLLPILIPVFLLSGKTFFDARVDAWNAAGQALPDWVSSIQPFMGFFGDKNVALILAALVALVTLAWRQKRRGVKDWHGGIQHALSSGGVIILITAAGGAFGHVLRQCGIAEAIQLQFPATQSGFTLLVVAFVITAIVRFAQGSATVAMITGVSIVAPLAATMDLNYHPLYLALAIGCGSKPLPWMNDSGFWIVGRMSGMTESETLKIHSVTLTIMGMAGFLVTLAGAAWLPLTAS